jgi:hypothetical protein
VPGRVARLDQDGNVIDAAGTIVATDNDLAAMTNELNVEILNRAAADARLQALLSTELETQIDSTLATAKNYTDNKAADAHGEVSAEAAVRATQDAAVTAAFQAADAHLQNELDSLVVTTGGNTTALDSKADLGSNGYIPLAQIPPEAITNWISVPNTTAMLQLRYPQDVQPGDIALTPQGVYGLIATDPGHMSSWYLLNQVLSVNSKTGNVVLTAADVNAIPVGGSVNMNQVTGLATALLGKTDTATTSALQSQVNTLANDPTLVHTVNGLIPDLVMPADIALVNSSGQVTNKQGQVVASGGPGGAGAVLSVNSKTGNVVLNAADVGALTQALLNPQLAAKLDKTDPAVTNARTPTAHASTHGSGGSDPITLATSQVTGLNTQITRIGSLETRVTSLESGAPAGGPGTASTTVFYDSANTTTEVSDFSQVLLHSPWGIDSDGTVAGSVGARYYLHSGVRDADVAYPYISPNGHLSLRRWNEAGPPDPTYATQTALDATNATVALKANSSDLTALSATVDTKANQSDLTSATNQIASKADQSALNATNATVATKANQSDLSALQTTVGTKADASALTTTNNNVTALQNQMPNKADLVSGKVPLNETPQNIPISYIAGLTPYLQNLNSTTGTFDAAKLTNTAAIPMPQSQVTGLAAALAAKADLDGTTHVPMAQIPAGAITNTQQVPNQAAMTALTTAQAHQGTICVIAPPNSAAGAYVLATNDPSVLANWVLLPGSATAGTITKVNGNSGPEVVLTAADVGAMPANATVPVGQVTGLQTVLNTFLYNSGLVKHADYVATTALTGPAGPAGFQSVDGVVAPANATVLCTAQTSSVYNGLWIVKSGNWTRPPDYNTGNFVAQDTIVIVSNTTTSAGGSTNPYTVWQMIAPGGNIDTAITSWSRIGWVAPPFVPVQGNGITISGSTISAAVAASLPNPSGSGPTVSGGLTNGATGLAVDPNAIPRKKILAVPATNPATVTHNLGTKRPAVAVWDTNTDTLVTAGVSAVDANSISIEFGAVPVGGQYVAAVYG